jgi:hypothetical protein
MTTTLTLNKGALFPPPKGQQWIINYHSPGVEATTYSPVMSPVTTAPPSMQQTEAMLSLDSQLGGSFAQKQILSSRHTPLQPLSAVSSAVSGSALRPNMPLLGPTSLPKADSEVVRHDDFSHVGEGQRTPTGVTTHSPAKERLSSAILSTSVVLPASNIPRTSTDATTLNANISPTTQRNWVCPASNDIPPHASVSTVISRPGNQSSSSSARISQDPFSSTDLIDLRAPVAASGASASTLANSATNVQTSSSLPRRSGNPSKNASVPREVNADTEIKQAVMDADSQTLFDMGFTDLAHNKNLLRKYDGDVNTVIENLLSQQ